jgi:glycosyltransferase involved in cell wall biosynthesis
LFVSVHPPGRVPSQRFRFEQYVDFLREEGFETEFAPVLRQDEYDAIYTEGHRHHLRKARIAARGLARRVLDAARASRYHVVVVQREAVQLGTALFERAMGASRAALVYDFDDAVWLAHTSEANRRLAWLKRPEKTAKIIELADMVFAGNDYLADYARGLNDAVRVVPTTIDTDTYVPPPRQNRSSAVCIGWSGSLTTRPQFELVVPVLRRLKERFEARVRFRVIGDPGYRDESLGIVGSAWRPETEVQDLAEFDVGLMPLPDDAWSRGKCGLKGLQYMALGIPPVMSPVGVNTKIVNDDENGLLAGTPEEWLGKLSILVESADLRARLGRAARQTVERDYSVKANKGRYLEYLTAVSSTSIGP